MAVILSALRAVGQDHSNLEIALERLRSIAIALDDAGQAVAVDLISEANRIVAQQFVEHERQDESVVYPSLSKDCG